MIFSKTATHFPDHARLKGRTPRSVRLRVAFRFVSRVRTYLLRHQIYLVTDLLRHLAADFAARIGCGVNVDVVLAGREVGGLRIGQRGAAFDRARCCVGNSNRDAGVLAGLGRAMEMRGGGGTGQAGIAQLPAQLLAGGIVVEVGGTGGGAGVRGAPGTCRRASPSSCRRKRGRQKQSRHPAQAWQAWSCSTWCFSLLTSNDDVSLKTTTFRIYSRNDADASEISWKRITQSAVILALPE